MTNVVKIHPHKRILFHGGCHDCTQQDDHPLTFCMGCRYFWPEWNLPNLNNRPPRKRVKPYHDVIYRDMEKQIIKHSVIDQHSWRVSLWICLTRLLLSNSD